MGHPAAGDQRAGETALSTGAEGSGQRSPNWADRLVMMVALLTAAVIVVVIGAVAWLRHTTATANPVSPELFARSAPARQADSAAGNLLRQQFSGLAVRASWLAPAGRSVLDGCAAAPGGLDPAGYGPSCKRVETRYYTYGGPDAPPADKLERVLRAQGWGEFVPASSVGGHAVVSAQPAGPEAGALAGKGSLEFSFAAHGRQFDPLTALGALRLITPRPSSLQELVQVSADDIRNHIYAGHDHVLVVSIVFTYMTEQPPP
jgi:hypothetical protein